MKKYISFCGTFNVPENSDLETRYPMTFSETFEGTDSLGDHIYREVSNGFRQGLQYETIDGRDSLTVYLAKVSNDIGHLVADCPAGGWVDEAFVHLDASGNPIKSQDNWNPNPVPQLVG